MTLDLFTLSEGAYNHNGHLTIVSTIDFINSESFPYQMPSLGIAVRMEFLATEQGKHLMVIQCTDEFGNKSLDMNVDMDVPEAEHNTIVCLASNVNGVQFQHPGIYTFTVNVDNQEYGKCKLNLIKKP